MCQPVIELIGVAAAAVLVLLCAHTCAHGANIADMLVPLCCVKARYGSDVCVCVCELEEGRMAGGTCIVYATAEHWLVVLCAGQDAVCPVGGSLAPLNLLGLNLKIKSGLIFGVSPRFWSNLSNF